MNRIFFDLLLPSIHFLTKLTKSRWKNRIYIIFSFTESKINKIKINKIKKIIHGKSHICDLGIQNLLTTSKINSTELNKIEVWLYSACPLCFCNYSACPSMCLPLFSLPIIVFVMIQSAHHCFCNYSAFPSLFLYLFSLPIIIFVIIQPAHHCLCNYSACQSLFL